MATFYKISAVLICSMVLLTVQGRVHKKKDASVDTATPIKKEGACVVGEWQGQESSSIPTIPTTMWFNTPSIIEIEAGHYQATGRIIKANYLKERLTLKDINFNTAERTNMDSLLKLDILADTFHIEGEVTFYALQTVKIYARKIVAAKGSRIVFATPEWTQDFATPVGVQSNGVGTNGENGKDGKDGPQVEVFSDTIQGELDISSKGGNGHKGQDGGNGRPGSNAANKADKYGSWTWCKRGGYVSYNIIGVDESVEANKRCNAKNRGSETGNRGGNGARGGNAGTPGRGGNAGSVTLRYRNLKGRVKANVCAGTGVDAANNGQGGNGGSGGTGVQGIRCYAYDMSESSEIKVYDCRKRQRLHAPRGSNGQKGAPGTTPNVKGEDGTVSDSSVTQSTTINTAVKNLFPEGLLLLIRRKAVDLLLGDSKNQEGKDALQFLVRITTGRTDVEYIMKDAQRKLAFVDKDGFDIFGKNSLFAPLVKWEELQNDVNRIKAAAKIYEDTFTKVMNQVNDEENFQQIATVMTSAASQQVNAQKRRLVAARAIDESEKRMYITAIREAETQMENTIVKISSSLKKAQQTAANRLSKQQFFAVLTGITGFLSAEGPYDVIDTAVAIAEHDANKACLTSLDSVIGSVKEWLTFGKYVPLTDSSELDFDKVKVSSVPEMMQAKLEMNKEQFAADLVCLLEEATKPRDVAGLKAEIESFFVLGAARIDMIAKIMDLDNTIGGHNFDIPLLEKTEKAITELSNPTDASITNKLRQTFLDNLLGTYKELERSFMENMYELQKALGFRFLWNLDDVMSSFQRIASESAMGTGQLNGAVELSQVSQRLDNITTKAKGCFSKLKYKTNVQKWSFDNVKDKQMFEEIKTGSATFSIGEDQICKTCHNARLIKMYVELYGTEAQPKDVWDVVRLNVRHLSRAYFRAGDGKIKQYLTPITSLRDLKFDRFRISDEDECRKRKKNADKPVAHFCVEEQDKRLKPMCSHSLSGVPADDLMMGNDECTSPSGFYELKIPVDRALPCKSTTMRDTNCKDIDLTKFTKMNVWMYYIYWSKKYPKDPNDPVCYLQKDSTKSH
ncbi:uncharacterized protein LOC116296688 [Actinia tenebrosa]|uniref:Uncharacterized protein LOC116296688 n=1 Tax=Actinia tenebrosa TaxID=6105 RepID=A0A6P8HZ90_ACTTE|nr:uncharacterized protein LOC116296688 [Actinia tenebrosa]